jgi:hypothetical protein
MTDFQGHLSCHRAEAAAGGRCFNSFPALAYDAVKRAGGEFFWKLLKMGEIEFSFRLYSPRRGFAGERVSAVMGIEIRVHRRSSAAPNLCARAMEGGSTELSGPLINADERGSDSGLFRLEIQEKAALYLSTGCEEFWVVDPKRQTVSLTRREGETTLYRSGDRIPLPLFDSDIEVSKVFG